jgi:hypothetical protein
MSRQNVDLDLTVASYPTTAKLCGTLLLYTIVLLVHALLPPTYVEHEPFSPGKISSRRLLSSTGVLPYLRPSVSLSSHLRFGPCLSCCRYTGRVTTVYWDTDMKLE